MNLNNLTKEELTIQLYDELFYYKRDEYTLAKIIIKTLPKSMVYRLISKLYRIRTEE